MNATSCTKRTSHDEGEESIKVIIHIALLVGLIDIFPILALISLLNNIGLPIVLTVIITIIASGGMFLAQAWLLKKWYFWWRKVSDDNG